MIKEPNGSVGAPLLTEALSESRMILLVRDLRDVISSLLVRYEELRADTLSEMKRIHTALEIPVDKAELARSVEKHSWENVSEEEKGQSKFYRRGMEGGSDPDAGRGGREDDCFPAGEALP